MPSSFFFDYTYTANSGYLLGTIAGPEHTVTNTWATDRNSLDIKNNVVDSLPVSQYTYQVNEIGQRTGVQTAGSAFGNTDRGWAWGYDSLGQTTKAVNAADTALNRAYAFDGIGNRLFSEISNSEISDPATVNTTAYTPNALNQYSQITQNSIANTPTYDADGNLLTDAGINALTYGLKYEWDAENRLIAVRKADDTLIATYVYDYMSRRIRKTTTADAYQGASDTSYLYDGWNVVAEYSISGASTVTLSQAYTWGLDLSGSMQGAGGVGGLLCIHRAPGTDINGDRTWTDTFYPTYDGNGNVSEYLDKNGAEAAHFEYDPFGRLASSTGSPEDFTYRFSTKPQDYETGLFYYGYRYYDPVTGRWPSRDPIGENGGENLYAFVENAGVNMIDIFGLEGWMPHPGTGLAPQPPDPDGDNRRRLEKELEERRGSKCCNYEKILEGKTFLIGRFERLRNQFRKQGINRGIAYEESARTSCYGQNTSIIGAFSTGRKSIPSCWECKLIHHTKKIFSFSVEGNDHWWVECMAYDQDGNLVSHISFDAWLDTEGAGDPQKLRIEYPYDLGVSDKDFNRFLPIHESCDGSKVNSQ